MDKNPRDMTEAELGQRIREMNQKANDFYQQARTAEAAAKWLEAEWADRRQKAIDALVLERYHI